MEAPCRCDGIGRRSGLKIHRWRQRAGSSPATGTKNNGRGSNSGFLLFTASLFAKNAFEIFNSNK